MITVDSASAVPPFEQLRQQFADQIGRGELVPGSQLPTVRRLAADLGLAPNTVARTYRVLERSGLVRTAGRRGTIVAESSEDVPADAQHSAAEFVRRMRGLGLTPNQTILVIREALKA